MVMAVTGAQASLTLTMRIPLPRHVPSTILITPLHRLSPKERRPEKWALYASHSMYLKANFGSSKGGAGLLERPTFDQSQFDPSIQVEEGGDIGRSRDRAGTGRGDSYRVLLIDDAHHTEKLVLKVLPLVVPSITLDDARRLYHKSQENGAAVVIVTVKEHAEFYSQMMIRGGLRSRIEPDSDTV